MTVVPDSSNACPRPSISVTVVVASVGGGIAPLARCESIESVDVGVQQTSVLFAYTTSFSFPSSSVAQREREREREGERDAQCSAVEVASSIPVFAEKRVGVVFGAN